MVEITAACRSEMLGPAIVCGPDTIWAVAMTGSAPFVRYGPMRAAADNYDLERSWRRHHLTDPLRVKISQQASEIEVVQTATLHRVYGLDIASMMN